ncbi:MAG: transposase [Planctomycetota bacterium]|jgi:transposase|nr:MAG: transposase [Planctomycetota bacterium]
MAKSKDVITQIKKATRRKFSADEKIRIVLEGLRGQTSISEVCRREGIAASVYYKWSKGFLEAGKNGLTRDTLRDATSDEVKRLRQENEQLKQSLADAILETQRYKKSFGL